MYAISAIEKYEKLPRSFCIAFIISNEKNILPKSMLLTHLIYKYSCKEIVPTFICYFWLICESNSLLWDSCITYEGV